MADPVASGVAEKAESAAGVVGGARKLTRFNVSSPDSGTSTGYQLPGGVSAGRQSDAADRPGPNGGLQLAGDEDRASPSLNGQINRDTSRFRIECVDEDEGQPNGSGMVKSDDVPDGSEGDTMPTGGGGHYSYDTTQGQKTFGRNTLETLPHLDHYRNLLSATGVIRKRPTLLELHEVDVADDVNILGLEDDTRKLYAKAAAVEKAQPTTSAAKFGWIQGVLVRCVLNIFGVMLFLRISWVVGQAGIGLATIIVLLASVVTTLTALSMSAICTNGQVRGGGAYYMISRSLGPEFGGAIGIVFSLANAVAAAMYVVGFAETIRDILKEHDCLMVDEVNDVRIIGLITAVVMMAIATAGLSWESKAQLVLLAILLVAIVNFIIGTFIPPTQDKIEKGVRFYSMQTFAENFVPDFRDDHSFFSVFAIFFPAATGILAGANISGDLRDAQSAIPKGTLLAIFLTTLTYLAVAWMAGWCAVRDAVGPVVAVLAENGSFALDFESTTASVLSMTSHIAEEVSGNLLATNGTKFSAAGNETERFCVPGSCKYGLLNDMQVMQLVSVFGPITIAGIVSATLSSALASLVSAPRVFQAVCKDKIFPYIHVFATGYGKADEPRRAYILANIICLGCVCIGDLNLIAPLISNFFLMSYALVNYSCFDASLAKSPGWRPAFKYYSMWLSLVGALLCLGVMFVMNWPTALITIAVIAGLFFYVHYRKPDINWGSSTQAHVYRDALLNSQKLIHVSEHVKNFRPQILVLTGFPRDRPSLVDFTASITKNVSLMICGHVILSNPLEKLANVRKLSDTANMWLSRRKTKSFYTAITAETMRVGVQAMLQSVGLGKLKPNVLLLGFKSNWQQAPPNEVLDYFEIVHDAFDQRCGVGILRLKDGLDCSPAKPLQTEGINCNLTDECNGQDSTLKENDNDGENSDDDDDDMEEVDDIEAQKKQCIKDGEATNGVVGEEEPPTQNVSHFNHKMKKGFVDVWWLFDDGGLTVLIPYILTTKKRWNNCKLRIYMAGTKKSQLDRDQRHLAALLSKFRIEYSSMTVVPDINKKPSQASQQEFDEMISSWKTADDDTKDNCPWKVSESELLSQREKTLRHIRLRELLLEHSHDASLVVMTLPMPRRGLCSAGLYMAWLDTLTNNMPPMLLLRGNQENVLTYYS